MVTAIGFDWGGVLIDDPAPAMMRGYAKTLGVTEEQFLRVYQAWEAPFQRGLPEQEFWRGVCGGLGVPEPTAASLWMEVFERSYREKLGVVALASSLRREGYRTFVLSNTEPPCADYFRRRRYGFDVEVFSCEVGMRKPEPAIY